MVKMMTYTKEQITARIAHLQSISPSDASSLFSELSAALYNYFTRDEEFEKLVRKTLLRVISDFFSRSIEVEYADLLPPLRTDFPHGYKNVSNIFGGDVFKAIMEIDDSVFVAAFQSETQSDGNTGTVILTNSYISTWVAGLSASPSEEKAQLEAIGEFCIDCNEERALHFIFLDLGRIQQPYAKDKRGLAKKIYFDRGFDWVIDNFDLNVFEPYYLPELGGDDDG